ncbi:MAG: hypothetical protein KAW92_03635 [Candidatus Cloacimonetes bacterium]|nr:hypothetical protein [Candidatus Cloacimonadota bacterium]
MDEKRKIIDMVAEGKITAEQAEKLLSALREKKSAPKVDSGKRLIFRITQEGNENPKVNIVIPIKLAKFGLNFIPKNANINATFGSSKFDMSSIDWQEIFAMASSGEVGDLFYMEVEEDDGTTTTIRIFVE